MNQKKYVAGIDIGTTKIVAIIGAENQYGKLDCKNHSVYKICCCTSTSQSWGNYYRSICRYCWTTYS